MICITIQDVIEKINNRFDLVLIAARRARQIQFDNKDTITTTKKRNSKYTVLALQEIIQDLVQNKISDI